MSYSVSTLFKDAASKQIADKTKSETLVNPDIPEMKKTNNTSNSIPIFRDQAHNALKLRNYPTNGMALLPKNQIYKDPRRDAFTMDQAINPIIIRNQVNPINEAVPIYNDSTLMGGSSESMEEENDSMELVRKARANYSNYVNRFDIGLSKPSAPVGISTISDTLKYGTSYKPVLDKSKIGYVAPAYNPIYGITGKTNDIIFGNTGRGVQG